MWQICKVRQVTLLHLESLILNDVLQMMKAILADYQDLLVSQPKLGQKILDILDGFVSVGWPDAQEFVYKLEEAIR